MIFHYTDHSRTFGRSSISKIIQDLRKIFGINDHSRSSKELRVHKDNSKFFGRSRSEIFQKSSEDFRNRRSKIFRRPSISSNYEDSSIFQIEDLSRIFGRSSRSNIIRRSLDNRHQRSFKDLPWIFEIKDHSRIFEIKDLSNTIQESSRSKIFQRSLEHLGDQR